jgi:hypothetical protein
VVPHQLVCKSSIRQAPLVCKSEAKEVMMAKCPT